MGKVKYLLIISVTVLILIGLCYALSMQMGFAQAALTDTTLIVLLPEECNVIGASEGIDAEISFNRDVFGNIVDRTTVDLTTKNVYAGGNASFRIVAQNISDIPISVDIFNLQFNERKNTLADLMYFSGDVKIYRGNSSYYDVLGVYKNIRLTELADNLTSLLKYRKIDTGEKLVLEMNQRFDIDSSKYNGKVGLSYSLVPVFVQYFPKNIEDEDNPNSIALIDDDTSFEEQW